MGLAAHQVNTMTGHEEDDEHTHLLPRSNDRRRSRFGSVADNASIASSVSKEEAALAESSIGERLPYNDYTTIDWLHDLVSKSPPCIHSADISQHASIRAKLTISRSKTPSATVKPTPQPPSEAASTSTSTAFKAGSQPP